MKMKDQFGRSGQSEKAITYKLAVEVYDRELKKIGHKIIDFVSHCLSPEDLDEELNFSIRNKNYSYNIVSIKELN